MSTSPIVRKVRMFNLQRRPLGDKNIETVLCPRCLEGYDRKHLEKNPSTARTCCEIYWTIEDAPTVQEGRRLQLSGTYRRALTCSTCNSGAGETFENTHGLLINKIIPETKLRIDETVKNLARNGPSTCSDCGKGKPVRIDITDVYEGLDASRIMELKEAYILAFAALGYSYILCPELDEVRRWIAPGTTELPVSTCSAISLDFLPPNHLAVLAGDIHGIAVALPAHHVGAHAHVVFLPRPGGPAATDFYRSIENQQQFQTHPIEVHPWPESGKPPFHWDNCDDGHPTTQHRYGTALGEIQLRPLSDEG